MKYGLSEDTIHKIHSVFASFPQVEKAVLYGSRAKGNYKLASDIDLTLYGTALTLELCGDIADELDELLLPYTIDLSIFDELEHAKLREHIERVGVVFYERAEKMAGWEVKRFEDCIEKVVYTKKIQKNEFLENGMFPIISQEQELINGYWNNQSDLFKIKTPIIVFGDHTQVLKYIDFNFVLGADGVKILQPKKNIDSKYFYYFIMSNEIKKLGYARHYRLLKEIEVPLPPLPEQQRIVGILDEVFAGIAQAKENAERNLKNARDIFESYLQSVFANAGDDWEVKKLGDVCEELFAGGDVQKDKLSRTKTDIFNIPIFTNGEKNKGLYGYTNIARVTKPSITISARGTIGYSEIREESFYPAIRLIVVTPKTNIISLSFLKFVISGIDFTHSGTSIPQLTVPMIKEYKISLPPIDEQQAIVTKLDSLSAQTKRLESIYQQKIVHLEELKKSVLQKAFSGEL